METPEFQNNTDLISKYLSGEITPKEQLQFNQWLNYTLENKSELTRFSKLNAYLETSIAMQEVDVEKGKIITEYKIWKDSQQKETKSKSSIKKLNLNNLLKVAAILFIFVGIAALTIRLLPGKSSNTYTEVNAPKGSRTKLKLPDGTTVWLNAGSTLKYASNFSKTNRAVQIEGEAFFDVTHDEAHPFLVSTPYINLKVLGTTFNIKAYKEENTIETTLVNGKVEIEKNVKSKGDKIIVLKPNQKAIFNKGINKMTVDNFKVTDSPSLQNKTESSPDPSDNSKLAQKEVSTPEPPKSEEVENTIAWKDGYLVFRNESLSQIITILSRRYNVQFVYTENEILNYRFTGKFKETTLEQVVQAIMLTSSLEVEVKLDKVFIKENPGLKK